VLAFPLYHLFRALPSTSLALHSSLPAIPQLASPGRAHSTCCSLQLSALLNSPPMEM
jgi:hypothetical protein